MIRKVIVALVCALLLGALPRAYASDMSLEEFLSSVRENNPGLQASHKRVEAAYHAVRAAVSVQRPSVGLRGSTSYNTDDSQMRQGIYSLSAAVSHRFDVTGLYTAQEKQLLLQYNSMSSEHLALEIGRAHV